MHDRTACKALKSYAYSNNYTIQLCMYIRIDIHNYYIRKLKKMILEVQQDLEPDTKQ